MQWHRLITNNEADDRCYQACIQMVLETFQGPMDGSKLDEATGYRAGKWTWPFQGMKHLVDNGLFVTYWDNFDAAAFTNSPNEWLINNYDSVDAKKILESSDIKEAATALNHLKDAAGYTHILQTPTLDTLKSVSLDDAAVIVPINSAILNGLGQKFVGHFVLLNSIDDQFVTFVDPGLPASLNRRVDRRKFLDAWQYPDSEGASLIVVEN